MFATSSGIRSSRGTPSEGTAPRRLMMSEDRSSSVSCSSTSLARRSAAAARPRTLVVGGIEAHFVSVFSADILPSPGPRRQPCRGRRVAWQEWQGSAFARVRSPSKPLGATGERTDLNRGPKATLLSGHARRSRSAAATQRWTVSLRVTFGIESAAAARVCASYRTLPLVENDIEFRNDARRPGLPKMLGDAGVVGDHELDGL